jgi:DUF1365 family protein
VFTGQVDLHHQRLRPDEHELVDEILTVELREKPRSSDKLAPISSESAQPL